MQTIVLARRSFNGASQSLRLFFECPLCGLSHSAFCNSAEWEAGRLARCPLTGERLRLVPAVDGATAERGRKWLASRERLRREVAQMRAQRQRGGAA